MIDPTKVYPHEVPMPEMATEDFERLRTWLHEQGFKQGSPVYADEEGAWCLQFRRGSIGEITGDIFRFKSVTAAIFFKLRWWDEFHG